MSLHARVMTQETTTTVVSLGSVKDDADLCLTGLSWCYHQSIIHYCVLNTENKDICLANDQLHF